VRREVYRRTGLVQPAYREWLYLAAQLLVGDELTRFLQMGFHSRVLETAEIGLSSAMSDLT
jgi:hypothetical protein